MAEINWNGTIKILSGLSQAGADDFPLVHAKDIQVGNSASNRLESVLAGKLNTVYPKDDAHINRILAINEDGQVVFSKPETQAMPDLTNYVTVSDVRGYAGITSESTDISLATKAEVQSRLITTGHAANKIVVTNTAGNIDTSNFIGMDTFAERVHNHDGDYAASVHTHDATKVTYDADNNGHTTTVEAALDAFKTCATSIDTSNSSGKLNTPADAIRFQIDQIMDLITGLRADVDYFEPKITNLSNNVGTRYLGYTLSSVTFTIKTNKKMEKISITSNKSAYSIGELDLNSITPTMSGKEYVYTYTKNYTSTKYTSTTDITFTVKVTDSRDAEHSSSIYVNIRDRVYYGLSASTGDSGLSQTFITSLAQGGYFSIGTYISKTSKNFSATEEAPVYMYYAVPARINVKKLKFNTGVFDGGFILLDTINFSIDGYDALYNIFRVDHRINSGTTCFIWSEP